MAGQMSDLMFNIVAQDRTRAAFAAANSNADSFGKKGAAAAREASKGIDVARGSVANLAAQFSDIGVQLSGGQSPLLIALQQGSQIGQVLGPLGAAGAVQTLGSAFLSLLSPVNLLTIGTIALGGAAFEYFSSMLEDGADAEETLERQRDLIGQVVQRWGDALPALREYADALERAEQAAQIGEASSAAASQQWAGLRSQAEDLNIEFADLLSLLQQSGAEAEGVVALQDAFGDLQERIEDGTATAQDAEQVQAALFSLFQETGIPAVDALMGRFAGLAEQIANASAQAAKFTAEGAFAAGRQVLPQLGTVGPVFSGEGRFLNPAQLQDLNARNTRSQTEIEQARLARRGGGGGGRGGGGGKSDEERQAESIQRVIQSLEDEQAALGKSKTEQRVMQALRRADVDATSAQGQQISQLITQIDAEKEALKSASDAADFMQDNLRDSFSELIPQIETGNKALDGFINRLIEASAEALFFGSGPFGGLFGGGGLFSIFGGGRAIGGAVDPWRDYLVGENGPEIVRIGSRGGVVGSVPDQQGGGTQGVHVTFGFSADNNGNIQPFVEKVAEKKVSAAVPSIVSAANSQVVPTMARYQAGRAGGDYRT